MTADYVVVWRGDAWREGAPVPPVRAPDPPRKEVLWRDRFAQRRILAATRTQREITSQALIAQTGLSSNTVGSVCARLVRRGQLERLRKGVYRVRIGRDETL